MSCSRWSLPLGSCRASINASRLTTDIWSKSMLFHALCSTKSTLPLGALSSTSMHWCEIPDDTHGAGEPTFAFIPVSVVWSHWLGVMLQSHATQAPTVAPTSGGLSPNLQYSLGPSVASLPIVHGNV